MNACNSRVCVFFVIIVLLTLANSQIRNMNQKQYNTIESYMDVNANPCTDFHQYACGNWETAHTNESYSDTFEMVDYHINQEFSHILKARKQSKRRQHKFVRQVLAFYKSCTTVEEYLPIKYLKNIETNEQIIWPDIVPNNGRNPNYFQMWMELKEHSDDDTNASFDWLKMLAILRKYNLNYIFISESTPPKRNDSSQYIVEIDRPILDDEFSILKRYQFNRICEDVEIKGKRNKDQIWRTINDFELEILKLYNIEDSIGYEEMILSETTITQLPRYLQLILSEREYDANMVFGIANRAYLHALFNLLSKYSDEFICRYLMVRFLWHLYYNGPTKFTKIECIANLRDQLPFGMNWMYEQNNPELMAEEDTINRIFESLRAHFSQILTMNANNLSDEVLHFLSTKLKHVQLKLGNLPRNATIEFLNNFHMELSLSENDFYGNHLKVLHFRTRKEHERLRSIAPQDAHSFYYLEDTGMAATATPYFLPRHNMVIVPLGLLSLPLYHPQFHDIYKYSLIGFLLAHEITHGFDDSGLDYDEYGNMHEKFGELIKQNEIFDEHLECLSEKNPKIIDEKIADVSGLRWAYETYFSSESQVAGKNLTWSKMPQEQLFFSNFAIFFCGTISNEETLVNSTHGTYRSRLYDALSHFKEFGRIYECPEGTLMNPLHKCQMWR